MAAKVIAIRGYDRMWTHILMRSRRYEPHTFPGLLGWI
jgi:hypothetical protein